MPIIASGGTLTTVSATPRATPPVFTMNGGSAWTMGYEADPATYAALYRTQPNVRTVVDFLARNIAQLGIHVFRRVSDTDRERLIDHELAQWIETPTPYTTRYRQIESTLIDLGIYFNAYWVKVRETDRIAFQRLPAHEVCPEGGLVPTNYKWTTGAGDIYHIPPTEVVHFHGYHPLNPVMGLSPLETLRRILAEDIAAGEHREALWRNAARIEGVVERPLAAKGWNPEQIESFRSQWHAKFSGSTSAGSVAVLTDGMTFKPMAFSPKQAEYLSARKLTREEVAAAYHVPLPMVGILDHATFSNIREQHKQLYQDCLGPWIVMLAEDIERQILFPECSDTDRVYVEFNIAEKLKGSFEEQAAALQTLVGRPIMTANEGRARLNLPSIDEPAANTLVRPLNTTPEPEAVPRLRVDEAAIAGVIARAWTRQRAELAKADPEMRAAAFDDERWLRELTADLLPIYRAAGYAESEAEKRSHQLARVVNGDTRALLHAGIAAFTGREATAYVA